MIRHAMLAAALALTGLATPAAADDYLGQYTAFIGRDDLYNSKGERLREPWQILRQDRANVHRFGITQPGDEGDDFFASTKNREAMERMLRAGTIDRSASKAIVAGGVMAEVEIWGTPGKARRLVVTITE